MGHWTKSERAMKDHWIRISMEVILPIWVKIKITMFSNLFSIDTKILEEQRKKNERTEVKGI